MIAATRLERAADSPALALLQVKRTIKRLDRFTGARKLEITLQVGDNVQRDKQGYTVQAHMGEQ